MPTSAAAYRPQAQPLPSLQVSSHSIWLLSWLPRQCFAIHDRGRQKTWCTAFAAFGVPSESPDASLLLAWLSRNMAMPAGLVIKMPADLPESIVGHISHLLQRLLKVR